MFIQNFVETSPTVLVIHDLSFGTYLHIGVQYVTILKFLSRPTVREADTLTTKPTRHGPIA